MNKGWVLINVKKRRPGIIMLLLLLLFQGICLNGKTQTAAEIIRLVKAKLDKVNDYEATGILKTNVVFIKAPIAHVKIYYRKPNRIKIRNTSGISFIPKGSMNINASNVLAGTDAYDLIDVGIEEGSGLRIIKLLPKADSAEVILSTLYIDEKLLLIKKAKTTTKDNGTYELEMTYGRFTDFGLADKLIFSFNIKDYKLPKGVTLDYNPGTKKEDPGKLRNKKGKVEISYSGYIINKGVPDSVFQ